ncbi:unnamed protein product [Acanthoscelides obtectus]|uniref:Uncharacterized protein n=1 Tax=Acanthoscelides obtectus TaxID=200917 RepID=A0A9P0VNA1_ACAOB|nr:unnamed protein product [Acanthoscelides obtectus]CAK1675162.1 hypothetical protein AOBTE_LOCUS29949 [Acanthoscelides obtectus]
MYHTRVPRPSTIRLLQFREQELLRSVEGVENSRACDLSCPRHVKLKIDQAIIVAKGSVYLRPAMYRKQRLCDPKTFDEWAE